MFKSKLIAPCGMNCAICVGYLREKNKCCGCRSNKHKDGDYIKKCSIINCKILKEKNLKHCSGRCSKYPCKRLKDLDKRYRTKYDMSMIDNLEYIEKNGIRQFIKKEKKKRQKGNKIICIHNKKLYEKK